MAKSIDGEGISIIMCTNKPHTLRTVFANYDRVNYVNKEMHIILNQLQDMNPQEWEAEAAKHCNVFVHQVSCEFTLGYCLNFGVGKCQFDYIAKFDDDDYYAPSFLQNSMKAFQNQKVGVVGRISYYMYLIERGEMYLDYNPYLRGGTLLFRRCVHTKIPFEDTSLGEDVRFVQQAVEQNIPIAGLDHRDFVYLRQDNLKHTWRVGFQDLIKNAILIARTDDYKSYVS
ncbi:glycosyltransferase family 2 protein [Hazenella sp. IB182353]|uniref:glycosyltransferase n=1 Tax=Polycladospora coralii TaxID=2771432 RepID=UPI0017475040|nr:glycosyltransferase family A protein [Polycladospora coralii]MBS7530090.1 glycosyltransferase family 2 protein [Polycladospora coralii]